VPKFALLVAWSRPGPRQALAGSNALQQPSPGRVDRLHVLYDIARSVSRWGAAVAITRSPDEVRRQAAGGSVIELRGVRAALVVIPPVLVRFSGDPVDLLLGVGMARREDHGDLDCAARLTLALEGFEQAIGDGLAPLLWRSLLGD
jgi:hypothetical protein